MTAQISPIPPRVAFEAHDREQLEFRHTFRFEDQTEESRFEIDTYMFVPKSVGLNSGNYARNQFYSDTTALMRLDANVLPLDALIDLEEPANPLHRLARALRCFQKNEEMPRTKQLAVHVKLFAYLQIQAVKQERTALSQTLPALQTFEQDLEQLLNRIARSLSVYRKLRVGFWPFEPLCHRSFKDALAFADEYMSLNAEEQLAALTDELNRLEQALDGSGFIPRVKARIRALAGAETAHRKKYGFLVHNGGKKSVREYFTTRRSQLKKSIHQALYLDARKLKTDAFIKNTVGAMGAALAAVWAWTTQLPATVANLPTDTKLFFFLGAVAAYVAKDRIKSLTNEYLVDRLKTFDHSARIQGASVADVGLGMLDGRLEERMRFCDFKAVDPSIQMQRQRVRQGRPLGDPAKQEEVIHYRKVLTLSSSENEPLPEGYAILDILRLNVRHFLVRLDDPTEDIAFYDPDRRTFRRTKLPKVYQVNVVIRIGAPGQTERLEHFLVILDKRGIVRIESI